MVIFVHIHDKHNKHTMNKIHLPQYLMAAAITLLLTSCRTTKQTRSTITSTTAITAAIQDSTTKTALSSQKTTLTITYIPAPITNPQDDTILSTPEPATNLIDQLLKQGGGTLIIQQETTQNQTQTTTAQQTTRQDTTTTKNTNHTEAQAKPSRASPVLTQILLILIAAAIFTITLKIRIRQ